MHTEQPLLSAWYNFTSSATDKWRCVHIYHWVVLWLLLKLILIFILFDLVCAPPLQIKLQAHSTLQHIQAFYRKVNTNFVSLSFSFFLVSSSFISIYFLLQTVIFLKNWTRCHIPDDKSSTLLEFRSSFHENQIRSTSVQFNLFGLLWFGLVLFVMVTCTYIFEVHEIFKWMPFLMCTPIFTSFKNDYRWTICELQ